MTMMVTRREILAQVRDDCSWSIDETRAAIAARFKGTGDVDLVALIDSWASDKKLTDDTLGHCFVLAMSVAKKRGVKGLAPPGAFKFLRQDIRAMLLKMKTKIEERED